MQAGGISARKWEERVLVYYSRKLLGVRTYHMHVRDMTYATRMLAVLSMAKVRHTHRNISSNDGFSFSYPNTINHRMET